LALFAPLFPVSPPVGSKPGQAAPKAREVYQPLVGANILCMVEQLDALTARMQELVAHVRQLREENHLLRTQLATSQSDLASLNERIAVATRRLDGLIERLPLEMRAADEA
jgi:uncharacterized protein (TIGR02449 family)